MIYQLKKNFPVLLFIISIVFYFEIALFIFIPKWDNLDHFFPSRYIVGDWIASGHFPLWNPYQMLGTPIHMDPQSGAWYPIVWIISLFGGYSFISFNFEVWLHIFIAGLGTYYFSKSIGLKKQSAFFAALVYMLSGIFVGSGQWLVMYIPAAWLPYSLMYLHKSSQKPTAKNLFLLGFFNMMAITGGHPGFTLLLFYIHLIFICYLFYLNRKNLLSLNKVFLFIFGALGFTIAFCSGYIISLIELSGHITRETSIPYNNRYFGIANFDFLDYLSFLFPFSSVVQNDFYATDVSLINAYIGLLPLLLAFLAIIKINTKYKWAAVTGLVFILLLSAGPTTFFHKLFYDYIPGFDRFRTMSFYRVHAIFILAILSGWGLQYLSAIKQYKNSLLEKLFLALFSLLVIFLIVSAFHFDYSTLKSALVPFLKMNERPNVGFYNAIFLQSLLHITVLLVVFYLYKKKHLTFKKICYITLFDLFIAIQLNAPTTLFYNKFWVDYQSFSHQLPAKLTNQKVDTPINELSKHTLVSPIPAIWKNTGCLHKMTYPDFSNPFYPKRLSLIDTTPLFNHVIQMPIAYFPEKIVQETTKISPGTSVGLIDEKGELPMQNMGEILGFSIKRNGFSFETMNSENAILFINQNYHKNWKAYIKQKEIPIIVTNKAFLGIVLPKGKHKIDLVYNSYSKYIGLCSIAALLVIGTLLFYQKNPKKN